MRKLAVFIILIAVLAVTLVPQVAAQDDMTTLVIGTTDDIAKLDPADAYSFHDWEIWRNINEGLMGFVPGGVELEPRLAVDFPEVSEDGLSYTFTVREDALFPDGSAVTADDIKRSIDRALALEGDPFGLISVIDNIEADGSQITFNLATQFDLFPVITALPPAFPVQDGAFPADEINNFPETAQGVGAYQLVEYTIGEQAVFEKNPNYFGEPGQFDRIIFVYYEEAAQLDAAIEAGDVDIAHRSNTRDAAEALTATDGYQVIKYSDGIRYLVINHDLVPDANVRQALAAAIDRDEIIDRALDGAGTPLYSMIPEGFLGANEAFLDAYGFGDPTASAELFAASGFDADNPYELNLWYPPNRYAGAGQAVMEVITEQLEATGVVNVEINSAEWSTYIPAATGGEYPVFFLGWFFDYPDSDNYIHPFASCEGSPGLGVNYCSEDMDSLINEERSLVADPATREGVFASIQELYATDVPTIPLFSVDNYMVIRSDSVGSLEFGATLILEYRTITMP